jgi:nicotinate-nucleotide pyrophosphorylase (carboxylating)
VTLGRLREIASVNVDYISSGALTHSAGTVDFGLDF